MDTYPAIHRLLTDQQFAETFDRSELDLESPEWNAPCSETLSTGLQLGYIWRSTIVDPFAYPKVHIRPQDIRGNQGELVDPGRGCRMNHSRIAHGW